MKTFRTFFENAPGMATGAVVGAGDGNSLKMKKMRLWKKIHRRHRPIGEKAGDISAYSKSKYYMQPDGSYKKGGDGRSEGLTLDELKAKGLEHKIK